MAVIMIVVIWFILHLVVDVVAMLVVHWRQRVVVMFWGGAGASVQVLGRVRLGVGVGVWFILHSE